MNNRGHIYRFKRKIGVLEVLHAATQKFQVFLLNMLRPSQILLHR